MRVYIASEDTLKFELLRCYCHTVTNVIIKYANYLIYIHLVH